MMSFLLYFSRAGGLLLPFFEHRALGNVSEVMYLLYSGQQIPFRNNLLYHPLDEKEHDETFYSQQTKHLNSEDLSIST
jgi:hypothetical protein